MSNQVRDPGLGNDDLDPTSATTGDTVGHAALNDNETVVEQDTAGHGSLNDNEKGASPSYSARAVQSTTNAHTMSTLLSLYSLK